MTDIEADPAVAKAGAEACERMLVTDLDRETPPLGDGFASRAGPWTAV